MRRIGGVLLFFLSALCLAGQAIQSAECGNSVDAQSNARRSKQGTTVVLKMHAEDDHAKDSQNCISDYFFAVTRADGTSVRRDITSVDDSYGRAIRLWVDGFADAGQRVIATILDPAMSSWAALTKRAGFMTGENLLILGATGVAGQLAIQIAKHLGARRVVAAGRNRKALERVAELGADAIVPLDQERESLVSSIHSEWTNAGIDVVLDYGWALPAEATLQALAKSRPQPSVSRVRFVQIGDTAGKTIQLPAAILRSSAIELLCS